MNDMISEMLSIIQEIVEMTYSKRIEELEKTVSELKEQVRTLSGK